MSSVYKTLICALGDIQAELCTYTNMAVILVHIHLFCVIPTLQCFLAFPYINVYFMDMMDDCSNH